MGINIETLEISLSPSVQTEMSGQPPKKGALVGLGFSGDGGEVPHNPNITPPRDKYPFRKAIQQRGNRKHSPGLTLKEYIGAWILD